MKQDGFNKLQQFINYFNKFWKGRLKKLEISLNKKINKKMKFLLISRHTGGIEVPANEKEQNFKELSEWITLLNASAALPVKGGKSITAQSVSDYEGIIEGALIFEAESIDEAVAKAKKSPGLKYGWTHDVLKELAM